jgi:hypothetical protein
MAKELGFTSPFGVPKPSSFIAAYLMEGISTFFMKKTDIGRKQWTESWDEAEAKAMPLLIRMVSHPKFLIPLPPDQFDFLRKAVMLAERFREK